MKFKAKRVSVRRGAMPVLCSALLGMVGCSSHSAPNVDRVQRAVELALSGIQKGGSVTIQGIQNLDGQNQAMADIYFDGFEYNANDVGTPLSRDYQQPKEPDPRSPNFNQELFRFGTQQATVRRYSGQGRGVIKRYDDGRWVLTDVVFNFVNLQPNARVE